MSDSRRIMFVILSVLAALIPGIAMSALLPHAPGGLAFSTAFPGIAYLLVFASGGETMCMPARPEAETWKYAGYVTPFAIVLWLVLFGVAMLWS